MQAPERPNRDDERVRALQRLGILDTPSEERYDRLTRVASQALSAPMAMINLVGGDRQWSKSTAGIDVKEMPRDISFCGHTILGDAVMVVEDTADDERFHDHPLVTGDPHIRFYAGTPLRVHGHNVGALCVLDSEPRRLGAEEQRLLTDLGQVVRDEMEQVAAKEAQDRLRSIIQTMPDALVNADLDGRITEMNPAAQRLLGYSADELWGQPLSVLMPERYREAHERGFERFVMSGKTRVIGTRVELHALHKDGHEIPVELSLAAAGTPTSLTFTGILRDLTRQRELDAERMQRRQREMDLARAREFDRLRSDFINTASHELYTPLTPIILQVENLRKRLPDHEDELRLIERNVSRLQEVVDQVMRVARFQETMDRRDGLVDLGRCLREVAGMLASKAAQKDVVVDLDVGPDLRSTGDQGQLSDAVWNILDNAIRYTPQGGRVTLDAAVEEAAVRIRVRDTGPGFGADEQEQAFKPFWQASRPGAPERGWGLGLFIAKSVVQRHGGSIRAVAGDGGVVEMELPKQGSGQPGLG